MCVARNTQSLKSFFLEAIVNDHDEVCVITGFGMLVEVTMIKVRTKRSLLASLHGFDTTSRLRAGPYLTFPPRHYWFSRIEVMRDQAIRIPQVAVIQNRVLLWM